MLPDNSRHVVNELLASEGRAAKAESKELRNMEDTKSKKWIQLHMDLAEQRAMLT